MKWTLRTLVRDNRGGSVGCGVMLVIHVSPSTPGALAVEWGEVEEEGWIPRDDDNNRNRGPGVGVAAALEAADAAMTHHIAMIRRTIIMNDEEGERSSGRDATTARGGMLPEMATSVAVVGSEGGGGRRERGSGGRGGVQQQQQQHDSRPSSSHHHFRYSPGGGSGGGFKFDANALLRVAADREADLLVVGSRALSPLRRAFIGGTARWCADHAPCAVVGVPSVALDI